MAEIRRSPTDPAAWQGARLHVVTGKGGVGKTSMAAALALALAQQGRRILLVEVEGRNGLARLFGTSGTGYEERLVATAPDGGEVYLQSIEPKAALHEYLEMFYHLGRAGSLLESIGAIDFATNIAPGLRDVLMTGKVYEAVGRGKNLPVYDAVVLDAPPTGRITRFLNVTEEMVELAKVGPIRTQCAAISALLHSDRTFVHLVTLPEDMPVTEAIEGVEELQEAGFSVGTLIVNMALEPAVPTRVLADALAGRLEPSTLTPGLSAAALPHPEQLADELIAEVTDHAQSLKLQKAAVAKLKPLGLPLLTIPLIDAGIDARLLEHVASLLTEQGVQITRGPR